MYSLTNITVGPSKLLARIQICIVVSLVLAALSLSFANVLYALPILGLAVFKGVQFAKGHGPFNRPRYWSVVDGQWSVQLANEAPQSVNLQVHHIWPFVVIFRYELAGKWHWEMIYQDAIGAEDFRQLRAELNQYPSPT